MSVTNYIATQAFRWDAASAVADTAKMFGLAVSIKSGTNLLEPCSSAANCIGFVVYPLSENAQTQEEKERTEVGVCTAPGSKVPAIAAGAIPVGSAVTISTDAGKVSASTGSDVVVGIALEEATAVNDVITILYK